MADPPGLLGLCSAERFMSVLLVKRETRSAWISKGRLLSNHKELLSKDGPAAAMDQYGCTCAASSYTDGMAPSHRMKLDCGTDWECLASFPGAGNAGCQPCMYASTDTARLLISPTMSLQTIVGPTAFSEERWVGRYCKSKQHKSRF